MIQLTITASTPQDFLVQLFGITHAAARESSAGGYPPPAPGSADTVEDAHAVVVVAGSGNAAEPAPEPEPEPKPAESEPTKRRGRKPKKADEAGPSEPSDADYAAATAASPPALPDVVRAARDYASRDGVGLPGLRKLLDEFGVKRVDTLSPDQFAAFIKATTT